MPIQKFRSLDRVPRFVWHGDAHHPEVADRIQRLWARSWQIHPRTYPRGVFKYRTLAEAQQARARLR